MSALRFEAVSYWYPDVAEPALRDVSVTVRPGELCLLAGPSASGKSTLLRAACGLVPHFHGGRFAGRATVAGLDTREHGPDRIAEVAGTLLQDPETQVVLTSVRAELAFPLENRGHSADEVARAVEEVALALGVEQLLDRPTHELSGGELQRVALGAALAGRPSVVLLDEPTSQLDPVAGDELVWLLRRLNEEWGTTVLLAEHRLERCLAAADRVLTLAGGALVHDGTPAEFLDWASATAPALATPGGRLFAEAGLRPLPVGVKQARGELRRHGVEGVAPPPAHRAPEGRRPGLRRALRRRPRTPPALELRGVWCEPRQAAAVLRGVDLAVAPGERVALMGRNGAGKTTLLRHAAGLVSPSRGRVTAQGRVALLTQHPGDLLLHERAGDEAPAEALAAVGLAGQSERHPRDLSGGQRQRLALAAALGAGVAGGRPAGVVCLDEPTRGMDRAAIGDLVELVAGLDAAVLVATHDPELAARVASRVVLMADGRVIADGAAEDLLAGGWYFSTETARILGGRGAPLLPEEGATWLRERLGTGTARAAS